ncbi:MFS transporter [Stenotrophomonas sp. S48]|uniref:MFS transporter n=1 Tax=unclassified Stenotrophomonas TaxID=196198 RepID=UPI001900B320|nr:MULTISPECIES: MFS transporter [unclassified Stenotrophomonas]MBK0024729.1 MFS transporter [Stenotrophomonas sp. S48]MBK0046949.1 MFS transporter [Stenotrophomonas sp. S49]
MPSSLSSPLRGLLAIAAGASVANVYYAQPLLAELAHAFALAPALAGWVVAATQAGSVMALLGLLPLADRLDRRRLLRLQMVALVLALLGLAAAKSPAGLLLGMVLVGLLGTALTQGLIACTAGLAAEHERGRAVGMVQGGVFIGLLLARVVSGSVAALAGWRAVYLLSAVMVATVGLLLWRRLPAMPAPAVLPSVRALYAGMFAMLRGNPALRERGPLALLLFAGLNVFWAAVPLPLSAPALGWSTAAIGALGLAGAFGAALAARVGQWMDRGFAHRVSLAALALMLLAWWPLLGLPQSVAVLLLGVVVLDLGGQALHVSNQSLLLRAPPQQHGRLVALYMLFYALGSGVGGALGPWLQMRWGWAAVCAAGAAIALLALGWWAFWRRAEGRSIAQ